MTVIASLPVRGRGRPSATQLAASLDASRRVNGDLRLELRAVRDESRVFAEEARALANRVHLATVADRPDIALDCAGSLVVAADRQLTRLGAR